MLGKTLKRNQKRGRKTWETNWWNRNL